MSGFLESFNYLQAYVIHRWLMSWFCREGVKYFLITRYLLSIYLGVFRVINELFVCPFNIYQFIDFIHKPRVSSINENLTYPLLSLFPRRPFHFLLQYQPICPLNMQLKAKRNRIINIVTSISSFFLVPRDTEGGGM